MLLAAAPSPADLASDWQAAQAAREAGDAAAYRDNMERVMGALPADHPNRPTVQYHLARAAALAGEPVQAAAVLQAMYDDRIEGLMMTMAAHDPAFDGLRAHPAVAAALALPDGLALTRVPLGEGLVALEGSGAWQVLLTGDDGALLVDSGYAAAVPALRQVLGDHALRLVVLTHAHEDHMGGLPALAAEAVVIAHPAARQQMAEPWAFMDGVEVPAKPAAARGDLLVDDTLVLHHAGATVEVHALPAHSGADLVVLFREHAVLHVGDNWLPRPGQRSYLNPGDDPDAWRARFSTLLDGLPPHTRVVSGHSAPAPVAELHAAFANTTRVLDALAPHLDDDVPPELPALADDSAGWVAFLWRQLRAARRG